ncbi:MAG TPA: hypothetical protein VJS30_08355 [Paraburkholderia sp.]|nr:hypothetical protein [Paraburkholderia sp.]
MLPTMSLPGDLAARARDPRRKPATAALVTPPFVHPGHAEAPRVLDAATLNRTREFNLTLPAGTRVGAALRALLDDLGAGAGCGRIAGGTCAQVQYHVITRAADGPRPYVYGAPIVCRGESTLIGAAITIGRRADGARILHCHGGFVDAHGQHHGGHVNLDETLASGRGLRVRLCLFEGIQLVVSSDAETAYDLLQPVRCS